MSATAGKVMPRPMGDYNASTEYKVLDIVTYNDRPYMAKQTTQGNLPTNTSYWMLLLDFPTLVDNVPVEDSENLVYSGGVYSSLAEKMKTDGTNGDVISIRGFGSTTLSFTSLTKDAGENQDVTIVCTATSSLPVAATVERLEANIGNALEVSVIGSGKIQVIFDSVAYSGSTITITGHLKEDRTDAISIGIQYGSLPNYGDGHNIVFNGKGNAAQGDYKLVIGNDNAIDNQDPGIVIGSDNVVDSRHSHAIGNYNYVHGNRSMAIGSSLIAENTDQTIIGFYNDNKQYTLFEVGAGSSSTRKNAFEVYPEGYISMNNGTDQYKFAKSGGIDGFYDGSNNFHPFYKELVNNSVVLSTSTDTTVTFTDASITADSTIEPFTDTWGINPKDVSVSAGSCTVTFAKVSSATTIKVKIRVS